MRQELSRLECLETRKRGAHSGHDIHPLLTAVCSSAYVDREVERHLEQLGREAATRESNRHRAVGRASELIKDFARVEAVPLLGCRVSTGLRPIVDDG